MPKVAPELPFPLAFPGMVPELAKAPELTEVRSAIYQQKNWKAPGRDNINSEIWKVGKLSSELLHQIIVDVWHTHTIPQDWLDAMIVPIYKRKGSPMQCDNYRGMSLLSTAGKVLCRLIANRIRLTGEKILAESQCGFRS